MKRGNVLKQLGEGEGENFAVQAEFCLYRTWDANHRLKSKGSVPCVVVDFEHM